MASLLPKTNTAAALEVTGKMGSAVAIVVLCKRRESQPKVVRYVVDRRGVVTIRVETGAWQDEPKLDPLNK